MAEILLDKVVDTVVNLATGRRYGVKVDPEFESVEELERANDRKLGLRPHSSLIILDMKGATVMGRYRLIKKS